MRVPRLIALVATLALLPAALAALVRRATLRDADFRMDLDPFEVDLQLLARND